MRIRAIAASILLILAIPFVFLGLIDPLEGGIALSVAGVIYLAASVIAAKAPPRYVWIPYVIAMVIGALALVLAILDLNDFQRDGPLWVFVRALLWLYRVAVLVTLVGSVVFAIKSLLALIRKQGV